MEAVKIIKLARYT